MCAIVGDSSGCNRGSPGITGSSGTVGDRVVSCLPGKVHDELQQSMSGMQVKDCNVIRLSCRMAIRGHSSCISEREERVFDSILQLMELFKSSSLVTCYLLVQLAEFCSPC